MNSALLKAVPPVIASRCLALIQLPPQHDAYYGRQKINLPSNNKDGYKLDIASGLHATIKYRIIHPFSENPMQFTSQEQSTAEQRAVAELFEGSEVIRQTASLAADIV